MFDTVPALWPCWLLTCFIGGTFTHECIIVSYLHGVLSINHFAPIGLDLVCLMVDGVPLTHVQLVTRLGLPALDQVLHHLFQRVGSMVLRLAGQKLKVGLINTIFTCGGAIRSISRNVNLAKFKF